MTEFLPQNETEDVILVKPRRFSDSRGYFTEAYHKERFAQNGIDCEFVQDNHSLSTRIGVLRGLHFQIPPFAQAKLVRCTRGRIIDYAVDIRSGSPGFGKHVAVELSEENGWQLYIPAGFAHAFCTMEDNCEVQYKVSSHYAPECDAGLAFDDPDLGIQYPFPMDELTLSDKDGHHPRLKDIANHFEYG